MNDKKTEALKLALEALKCAIPHKKRKGDDDYLESAWGFHNKAIATLQEALINHSAQQEWKYVPYDPSTEMQEQGSIASGYDLSQTRAKKVYQAMIDMHDVNVERKALALGNEVDQEESSGTEQPAQKRPQNCGTSYCSCIECVMEPAQQEPVEFLDWYDNAHWGNEDFKAGCWRSWDAALKHTSPPASKPLTDEEIENVWRKVQANDFHDCVQPFARAIEAAHGIKGDA